LSRWSVRTLAKDLQLPPSTVQQILAAFDLQPHRIRTFPSARIPILKPSSWTPSV
jgi:hypothetical protein